MPYLFSMISSYFPLVHGKTIRGQFSSIQECNCDIPYIDTTKLFHTIMCKLKLPSMIVTCQTSITVSDTKFKEPVQQKIRGV